MGTIVINGENFRLLYNDSPIIWVIIYNIETKE